LPIAPPDQTDQTNQYCVNRLALLPGLFILEVALTIELTKTERLAAAMLADRQRAAPDHNIIAWFSCGTTFVYRGRRGELNGRFCSMRCQQWYDDGNPSYERSVSVSAGS
jgi:hypothetical protein